MAKNVHSNSNEAKEKNVPSFHTSIGFIIILGQIFGLMPVQGITGPTYRSLSFSWRSWRTIYSLLIVLGTAFSVYATIYLCIVIDTNVGLITAVMFFGSSCAVHFLFIQLAKDWSKLMRAWYLVDVSMRTYGWPPKLNLRLRLMAGVILTLAAVEHLLAVTNNIMRSESCRNDNQDLFEYWFVKVSYPQVFLMVEYHIWAGILMQIVNLVSTFSWTYIDLFIMLMSTSLALRLKQIAQRVEVYVESKVSDELLWRNIREDYSRLSKLCRKMNDELSYIVLVSFGNDLFFIVVQFFHSIRKIQGVLEKLYFFFSFGFLIGRTFCVSFYGSWIHDESQSFVPLLNNVSTPIYNTEIRRFLLHVHSDPICLSGKRFFNVTRSLILSIAGTIVTYELVLIQFYGQFLERNVSNSTC